MGRTLARIWLATLVALAVALFLSTLALTAYRASGWAGVGAAIGTIAATLGTAIAMRAADIW